MSLKRNILANSASQIYASVAGLVMLPVYIGYMGTEAYGLVGFFATVQAWLQLLDMGLTPTMARQTACYSGGATDALELRRFVRALEGIFFALATLMIVGTLAAADFITTTWLNVETLPHEEVRYSIMLMGPIIALRWISGLYRGAISGFEKLVWLSGWNSLVATFRFVLVVPVFAFIGILPSQFFFYQFVVAVVELAILMTKTYRLLPSIIAVKRIPWSWTPLRKAMDFSVSIAFASVVWTLFTQTDKLILSKFLTLTEYGYFTLAVLVASGVLAVVGPISGALIPRLTRLFAEGNVTGLICLYKEGTQLVAMVAISTSLVLAFFSQQVIWAWTGSNEAVQKAAPILTLYAVGNAFLVLGAFPYYLQYAKGNLRLHLLGNVLFLFVLIPAIIWATVVGGTVGAGWAWLVANLMYFLAWIPIVHHRLEKGLHRSWVRDDLGKIALPSLLFCSGCYYTLSWPAGRATCGLQLVAIGFLTLLAAALGSSFFISRVMRYYHSGLVGK